MKRIINLFLEHPRSRSETYIEHLVCAASYGFKMIFAGFAVIIHSIFPFLFETTASDLCKKIVSDVKDRPDSSLSQTNSQKN
ncbi:MAG: hypothetical protein HOK34_06470 [Gammaproteobacteria bacterium]|jgi:4-hydroxybenzoate polyprenyltransferase|nr:hypothetical protein [Gammaproteobacteria bacterium]